MKVKDCPEFNPEFPEKFNWNCLDSPTLSRLAVHFASRINGESLLIPSQRHSTSGLREALRAIANEALL